MHMLVLSFPMGEVEAMAVRCVLRGVGKKSHDFLIWYKPKLWNQPFSLWYFRLYLSSSQLYFRSQHVGLLARVISGQRAAVGTL